MSPPFPPIATVVVFFELSAVDNFADLMAVLRLVLYCYIIKLIMSLNRQKLLNVDSLLDVATVVATTAATSNGALTVRKR